MGEGEGWACAAASSTVCLHAYAFCPHRVLRRSPGALVPVLSNGETEVGRCSGFSQCL